jgi:hypothetical protein
VVNEDVGRGRLTPEAHKPVAKLGVCGSVEDLEMVAPASEEAPCAPRAPGWVTDVEQYLLLIHRTRAPSLLAASRDRFAQPRERRIAQMSDFWALRSVHSGQDRQRASPYRGVLWAACDRTRESRSWWSMGHRTGCMRTSSRKVAE